MMNSLRLLYCGLWGLMGLLVPVGAYAGTTVIRGDSNRIVVSSVSWPIDTKVDTVLKLINSAVLSRNSLAKTEQLLRQQQFAALFTPSGYFIVILPNKTELWVSVSQFLARLSRVKGVQYQLKAAKVIHFKDVNRNQKGNYSSRAIIYFDVNRFDNHLPVTQTLSRVTIPLTETPPAADYWQIYELKVVEVSNSVLASPR